MSQLATQIDAILRPRCQRGGSLRLSDANCWARDLRLDCAPRGSTNGSLLTPSTMLFAAHFDYDGAANRTFIAPDGTKLIRQATSAVIDPISSTIDQSVYRLNSAVPSSIRVPRILPSNFTAVIPNFSSGLHAVVVDMADEVTIHQVSYFNSGGRFKLVPPTDPLFLKFHQGVYVGDSSSAVYLVLPNQTILIGCLSKSGYVMSPPQQHTTGHFVTANIAAIEAAMKAAGIDEPLRYANLSNVTADIGDGITPMQPVATVSRVQSLLTLANSWRRRIVAAGKAVPPIAAATTAGGKVRGVMAQIETMKGLV